MPSFQRCRTTGEGTYATRGLPGAVADWRQSWASFEFGLTKRERKADLGEG